MTTRESRTKPSTEYTTRASPLRYIQLLEDAFDNVRDLDWEDIYVYADSWLPVSWTIRTARTKPA